MKISTKTRYGIRALLELAIYYGKKSLNIKSIAKSQSLPEKYLEHVLAYLKTAGLVKSVRGAKGGYTLALPPSEIRLNKVFQVLEGSLSPVECVDNASYCKRSVYCATKDIWGLISRSINQILYSVTLQDLVQRQLGKEKYKPNFYNI